MGPEEKWWEPSDSELEDMIQGPAHHPGVPAGGGPEDRLEDGPLDGVEEAPRTLHPLASTETPLPPVLAISAFALAIGLISPWEWHGSGFQALSWSISDLTFIFTEGLNNYSEWGFNPLSFIGWAMFPMLSLVFVTTFVATWYKSRQGDEEFGRKASIFHLSFFGVWYLLSIINSIFNYGYFEIWLPTEWNYGIFIAAASGIGLHPTVYGLVEKLSNSH